MCILLKPPLENTSCFPLQDISLLRAERSGQGSCSVPTSTHYPPYTTDTVDCLLVYIASLIHVPLAAQPELPPFKLVALLSKFLGRCLCTPAQCGQEQSGVPGAIQHSCNQNCIGSCWFSHLKTIVVDVQLCRIPADPVRKFPLWLFSNRVQVSNSPVLLQHPSVTLNQSLDFFLSRFPIWEMMGQIIVFSVMDIIRL